MRRATLMIAAVALLAVGWPADAAPVEEPGIEVTVQAPPRLIADGVDVFKIVARVGGIDEPYDLRLVGHSDAYPHADVFTRTSTLQKRDRTILTVAPVASAEYEVRAVVNGEVLATSRTFTVVAHPYIKLKLKRLGAGVVRLDTTAVIDRGDLAVEIRPGSAMQAAFYYRLQGEDKLKQLAMEDLEEHGCKDELCRRSASHTIYDTALLSGIAAFTVCYPGRIFAGVGDVRRCPQTMKAP